MRYFQIFLVIYQLLFLKVIILPAQKVSEVVNTKTTYDLLLDRFKVYLEYYLMTEEVQKLYDEALEYARLKDYDIAAIILEEALFSLKSQNSGSDDPAMISLISKPRFENTSTDFKFGLLSGMDYNSQEFEVGFLASDSTVKEEFNKPYVGFSTRFSARYTEQASFEVYNSLRFDKENLRDDYRIRWQTDSDFYIQYAGYWNETRTTESSSYWDQVLSVKLNNRFTPEVNLSLFNNFNYKSYRTFSMYLRDYYRNRLDGFLEWNTPAFGMIGLGYINEFNETLGHKDNDYIQHNLRVGFRNTNIETYYYNLLFDAAIREYSIQFDDSLINNKSRGVSIEALYEVSILRNFRLTVEENFIYKVYKSKSSLEPDYYWNYLRPALRFQFLDNFKIGVGYEWEFKEHISNPFYEYNVNEQNYDSDGIFLSANYFSASGLYISSSLSYQWRRYPSSITNDLISIYSNQNIFSIMLIAYLPITDHLILNSFITYDTDQDIDFDQQNNKSTIFTLELEYIF